MKLYDIAHSRAGDKGNTLTLSLIPYSPADYDMLQREITAERVAAHLATSVRGEIRRYEMPRIHALLFVCEGALDGGVTTSLAADTHGKCMSGVLLDMEIGGGGARE
ncbi:hypothetical protein CLV84_1383 [Neolewinella xylanilytica]|uniref:AtuA-like ferredoxin-fold domain-containing protein n=1 Tax=Neolewinella xylanilytica TaxID=1514080 RepID=A0A2S6IAA0_9BACT|nr:hypothetical protein [Neolewinella xylanilytica]PPK88416.1 hypothetical protein CLV84_1383 [Neolewinella xylanilytica]